MAKLPKKLPKKASIEDMQKNMRPTTILIFDGERYFDESHLFKCKLFKTTENKIYYFYLCNDDEGNLYIQIANENNVKEWLFENHYDVYVKHFGENNYGK